MSKFLSEETPSGYDEVVIDPNGEQYTHLGKVIVYARTEDQHTCVQVVVDCYTGKVGQKIISSKHCPSPRRQAVELVFRSELGSDFSLTHIQHKGSTFVEQAIYGDSDG